MTISRRTLFKGLVTSSLLATTLPVLAAKPQFDRSYDVVIVGVLTIFEFYQNREDVQVSLQQFD